MSLNIVSCGVSVYPPGLYVYKYQMQKGIKSRDCITEPLRCGQTLGMESGYIEDFQINVTSEDPLFLKNSGRPGDTGWCYNDEDSEPRFQVKTPSNS